MAMGVKFSRFSRLICPKSPHLFLQTTFLIKAVNTRSPPLSPEGQRWVFKKLLMWNTTLTSGVGGCSLVLRNVVFVQWLQIVFPNRSSFTPRLKLATPLAPWNLGELELA